MPKKLTQEEAVARCLELGFDLGSNVYINSLTKMHNIKHLVCGSTISSCYSNIYSGYGCSKCGGKEKHTVEAVIKHANERGFNVEADNYVNNKTKMYYTHIVCGYRYLSRQNDIDQEYGCPNCYGNVKKTLEYVSKRYLELGFIVDPSNYENNKTLLNTTHIYCGFKFPSRLNSIDRGSGCPACSKRCSKFESFIFHSVLKLYPEAKRNTRGLFKNPASELDIYIESLKKAIECDGPWHYELMGRTEAQFEKTIKRDARKDKECFALGIQLLRIKWSDYIKNPQFMVQRAIFFLGGVKL
jgi:hypothetical protein